MSPERATPVSRPWTAWRPAVAVATVVAVLGLAACGGSDDATPTTAADAQRIDGSPPDATTEAGRDAQRADAGSEDDSGAAGAAAGGTADGSAPKDETAAEEARVASTVTGMYADLAAGDAAAVCAAMSRKARAEIGQASGQADDAPSSGCAATLSSFLTASKASGALNANQLRTKVKDVEIDGGTAIATIELGGREGRVALLREGGAWRFGALPSAAGQSR